MSAEGRPVYAFNHVQLLIAVACAIVVFFAFFLAYRQADIKVWLPAAFGFMTFIIKGI